MYYTIQWFVSIPDHNVLDSHINTSHDLLPTNIESLPADDLGASKRETITDEQFGEDDIGIVTSDATQDKTKVEASGELTCPSNCAN